MRIRAAVYSPEDIHAAADTWLACAPFGDDDGVRIAGEQPFHFRHTLKMAVGEALALEPQFVDRGFVADRRDDVLKQALVR